MSIGRGNVMSKVTNSDRANRSFSRADELATAIERAKANPQDHDAWKDVATLAGNIQRDARLLAGLGRGG